MARIYRKHPDSSYLDNPRVFVRVFCRTGELEKTADFYKTLTGAGSTWTRTSPRSACASLRSGPS